MDNVRCHQALPTSREDFRAIRYAEWGDPLISIIGDNYDRDIDGRTSKDIDNGTSRMFSQGTELGQDRSFKGKRQLNRRVSRGYTTAFRGQTGRGIEGFDGSTKTQTNMDVRPLEIQRAQYGQIIAPNGNIFTNSNYANLGNYILEDNYDRRTQRDSDTIRAVRESMSHEIYEANIRGSSIEGQKGTYQPRSDIKNERNNRRGYSNSAIGYANLGKHILGDNYDTGNDRGRSNEIDEILRQTRTDSGKNNRGLHLLSQNRLDGVGNTDQGNRGSVTRAEWDNTNKNDHIRPSNMSLSHHVAYAQWGDHLVSINDLIRDGKLTEQELLDEVQDKIGLLRSRPIMDMNTGQNYPADTKQFAEIAVEFKYAGHEGNRDHSTII